MSGRSNNIDTVTYRSSYQQFSVLEVAREVNKAYKATANAASVLHVKISTTARETLREEVAHFIPQAKYRPLLSISGHIKKNEFGEPISTSIRLSVDDTVPLEAVYESAIAPLKDRRVKHQLSEADTRTAIKALNIT